MEFRGKNYKEYLTERLRKDPSEAAEYLNAALEEGLETFLLAYKDVIDALGGTSAFAKIVKQHRVSIHKMFSAKGNPTLKSLTGMLDAAGLRLEIVPKKDEPVKRLNA